MSSSMVAAKPANSMPSVIGTASCSWVRPTLITGANARARSAKASASRCCSARSGAQASSTARRIAVG